MNAEPKLILASASLARLHLLETIGIVPDKIIASNIDETAQKAELPHILALRLAREKNLAIKDLYQGNIILTADTVVACGRFVLPKAETKDDFDLCMKKLSGRRHTVMTAIAVCDRMGIVRSRIVHTKVKVKRLTPHDITLFYQTKEWRGKAGGYALQGYFGRFIEMLCGSYSAVIGLPVAETANMLCHAGLKPKPHGDGEHCE